MDVNTLIRLMQQAEYRTTIEVYTDGTFATVVKSVHFTVTSGFQPSLAESLRTVWNCAQQAEMDLRY